MPTIRATIRSRIPRREVVKLVRSLPGVLSGRLPDRYGVGKTFRVNVGVSLLGLIYRSYITKARGNSDVLSQQWQPLKPSTIKAKRKLGLSPYRARLINRRTDRLLLSLKPGTIARGHYRPAKEQVFDIDGPFVVVGTSVPYAKFVHAKRPLWPKAHRLRDWMMQTARGARDEVLAVLTKIGK